MRISYSLLFALAGSMLACLLGVLVLGIIPGWLLDALRNIARLAS